MHQKRVRNFMRMYWLDEESEDDLARREAAREWRMRFGVGGAKGMAGRAGQWVKVHRKMIDHQVFADRDALQVWMWCLLRANWKESFYGHTKLQPGEFVCGSHAAAQFLRMSRSKFNRVCKRLKAWKLVDMKSNNRFTVVSVCKWRTYQSDSEAEWTTDGQPADNQRTTSGQPADTEEEDKELKEVKKERNIYANFPDFEEFWQTYPDKAGRRVGKEKCLGLWRKLSGGDRKLIQQAAANYAADRSGREPQYTKNPQGFFKDGFWRDWVESIPSTRVANGRPSPEQAKRDLAKRMGFTDAELEGLQ